MAGEITVSLLFKAIDQVSAEVKKIEGSVGKMGAAAGVAWKVLGGAAATTAIGFLTDAARAAADDEASVLRLKQAVENTGASWDDQADAIAAVIKKGQDLAYTDDQTRDSLSRLTAITGDANKAMDLNSLAMDLARGKNIDLGIASDIVGRVAEGNVGILKRYGIVLKDGATVTEALGALHQKFGGQAAAYGSSTKGSIDKVKDAISEWREGIGTAMGPAVGFIALLPGMSVGLSSLGGVMTGLSGLIKMTFIPSLIAMAIPFLPLILVIGAVAIAIALLALAWSNNWGDIQGKTVAVIGFLKDLFYGFELLVLGIFRGIVVGVAGAINNVIGVINGFIDAYNALAAKLGLPLLGTISLITPNLNAVDQAIANVARDREARIMVNVYEQAIQGGGGVRQYAEGTPYVPYTGLAVVHQGERIIPANQNTAGGGAQTIITQVFLDGRQIATAIGGVWTQDRRNQGLA